MSSSPQALLATSLALVLSACVSSDLQLEYAGSSGGSAAPLRAIAGFSVEGRPIEFSKHGAGSRVVLILAGIHGEEPAGVPLVRQLDELLTAEPGRLAGYTAVLLPAANPDGLVAGRRPNARGVDLNRNFPSRNFDASEGHGSEPLSEPESRALAGLLERFEPDLVLSIHQPLECIDYDGPAREIARALAATCDLPVRKLGGRPGSLGSYVGLDLGMPIVTVELPSQAERQGERELWKRYGALLLAALGDPPDAAFSAAGQ